MAESKFVSFSPGRILLASISFVIAVGTILLSLPQAREVAIPFIDVFFTAVSATCVTGLEVIPLSHFTFFGKCVILGLIQIGGLGLMTLSFFLISLILKLGMTTRMMAGQLLDFELWGKVKTFLMLIIGLTFTVEFLGAFSLYPTFIQHMNASDAVFYSIFHSVSAFCNAGLTLFEHNLVPYSSSAAPLLILAFLTIAGGIGFVVWYDFFKFIRRFFHSDKNVSMQPFVFSLHTKLVLVTTALLLIVGTIVILAIERHHSFKELSFFHSVINAFFCSATIRSAGFNSFNLAHATNATLFFLLLLMFIGASPSSTGGGVKTSTFALFIATVFAFLRNRQEVEIFGRTIPTDQLYKVVAIVTSAMSWIFISTFILLLLEKNVSFAHLLFESVSAFSTVGLSAGITAHICMSSKAVLIISMIAGRIGLLTLVLALRRKQVRSVYRYPEERIVIG